MWLLNNETPFAAERTWTRDERGAEFWLVAVRASFEIDPEGRQFPADDQTELQRTPVFAGDPQTTGLLTDSDFALDKHGTDVLVDGCACAAGMKPVTKTSVQLQVSDINKRLDVLGERILYEGAIELASTKPQAFLEMPLVWERTYGGWDKNGSSADWVAANPAGTGFAVTPSHLYGTAAPNIEYRDAPYRGPKLGKPAAFGPVAHHWQPRVGYAGTYDKHWEAKQDPLPPDDFDRRYFQTAPADQQTAKPISGFEEVRLQGFTPDGMLRFTLPRINFDFVTTFKKTGDVRHRASVHTLWLMPSRRRFEIVYVSSLEVPPGREEKLVGTTIRVKRRVGTPNSILRTGVWSMERAW